MKKITVTEDVRMDTLRIGEAQARLTRIGEHIDELAQSIKKQGLLQPIVVCPGDADGTWEILMGQRRFLACKELGYETIRASIIPEKMNKFEAIALSLSENLIREDLNRKDAIDACTALYKKYGTLKGVCDETGLSLNKVREYIKYDRLDDSLKDLVDTNEIDIKTALRAMDASEAVDGGKEETIKLAKEMSAMSGAQQKKIVETLEEDPSGDVDNVIEAALQLFWAKK